ncbi:MAG: Uma2 family endonuclease [Leptolyngbyaceae cyanobacterium SU_3_3]|nr:Uma2 family endonuclease [Leptolyngbyaceae cyanobacterium SU_3_3]NJR53134.1 Uma2 family endonuclease [Leptolyngbyaceae cyanobacterium CSU_1_3]
MVQAPSKLITLEEFLELPETEPASEYIDGQIVQKPMPKGKHSKLQVKLVGAINQVVEASQIAEAFTELRCTFAGRSIVPDIAVFTWDRIPVDAAGDIADTFDLAPDWVIEILSPDQNQTQVVKKIFHCLDQGCQLGWLVDPAERCVFIYPSRQHLIFLTEPNDVLVVPEFAQALQLTVGTLFGWLQRQKR